MVTTLSFVSDKSDSILCNKIHVEIIDSMNNAFIKNSDIVSIILDKEPKILGKTCNQINTKLIERDIIKHPSIATSQVYKTIDGRLNILVDQRNPVVRIIPKRAKGFYIDRQGKFMPLSDNFSSHVVAANGEIDLILYINKTPDVQTLKNKLIQDLYKY